MGSLFFAGWGTTTSTESPVRIYATTRKFHEPSASYSVFPAASTGSARSLLDICPALKAAHDAALRARSLTVSANRSLHGVLQCCLEKLPCMPYLFLVGDLKDMCHRRVQILLNWP